MVITTRMIQRHWYRTIVTASIFVCGLGLCLSNGLGFRLIIKPSIFVQNRQQFLAVSFELQSHILSRAGFPILRSSFSENSCFGVFPIGGRSVPTYPDALKSSGRPGSVNKTSHSLTFAFPFWASGGHWLSLSVFRCRCYSDIGTSNKGYAILFAQAPSLKNCFNSPRPFGWLPLRGALGNNLMSLLAAGRPSCNSRFSWTASCKGIYIMTLRTVSSQAACFLSSVNGHRPLSTFFRRFIFPCACRTSLERFLGEAISSITNPH